MYLPAIVMVGYYFEKRRAFATGIAVCGSGIGNFVFAPLCEFMLHDWSWKGGMWIISGLVLNGVVFALFFRPLPATKTRRVRKDGTKSKPEVVVTSVNECGDKRSFVPSDFIMDNQNPIYRCKSVQIDKCCRESGVGVARLAFSQDMSTVHSTKHRTSTHSHKDLLRPLSRKDIFYGGSLRNLPEYKESHSQREFTAKMTVSDDSNVISQEKDCSTKSLCAKIQTFLSGSFDISLLKSPTFLIYGTSCFLCMFGKSFCM